MSLHRLPDQGVCLSLPLLSKNSFSPLQHFLNLSTLMPSHLFSAHSWKSHFCSFLAIFHFFLFLLLFNCEKYFLLQEKCPYALLELESCCSLFAESYVVVFNAHPEMSVPFRVCGGRNLFDVIYETSCGGDQVTSCASPFVAHQQLNEASTFCLYIISGLTMEESRRERLMGNLYSRLTLPDMVFLRCSILVFKALLSASACFRKI